MSAETNDRPPHATAPRVRIIGRIVGDGEVVLTAPWTPPADAPAPDQALQDAPRDPD